MVAMERNRVNMAHPDFIGHRDNFGEFTQEVEEEAASGPPPPPAKTMSRQIVKEGHANKKGGNAIVLWQKRYLILKKVSERSERALMTTRILARNPVKMATDII